MCFLFYHMKFAYRVIIICLFHVHGIVVPILIIILVHCEHKLFVRKELSVLMHHHSYYGDSLTRE